MFKWILALAVVGGAAFAFGTLMRPPGYVADTTDVAAPAALSDEEAIDSFEEKPSPVTLGAGPSHEAEFATMARVDGQTDQGML